MKKILSILIISSTLFTLSGCAAIDKAKEFISDVKNSYNNVSQEAEIAAEKLKETKEKIEETVDDVNKAVEKIKETKEAIDEITE